MDIYQKIYSVTFSDNYFVQHLNKKLVQYNYGQMLRVQGIHNLPSVVPVSFSLQESGGKSKTFDGVYKDGVLDVVIPDFIFEGLGEDQVEDYKAYAFITVMNTETGRTVYKVTMDVLAIPKSDMLDKPEQAELFKQTVEAVNKAADRAYSSETNSKSNADKTNADTLKTASDLKEVGRLKVITDNNREAVEKANREVQDAKQRVVEAEQTVTNHATNIEEDRRDVDLKAEQVERTKTAIDLTALEVSNNANRVEGLKNTVVENTETVLRKANEVEQNKNNVINVSNKFQQDVVQAVVEVNNAGTLQKDAIVIEAGKQIETIQNKGLEETQRVKQEVADEGSKQLGILTKPSEKLFSELKKKTDSIYVDNTFADAFVQNDFGAVVVSDMVSPVKHNVKCVCESANLIPYPYTDTTKTENGITWTDNGDGSITVSGVATGYTTFNLSTIEDKETLEKLNGVWCFSNADKAINIKYVVYITANGKNYDKTSLNSESVIVNFDEYKNITRIALQIKRNNNVETTGTIKPMLNRGTTPLPYTPYVSELGNLEVMGANLIDESKITKIGSIADFKTEYENGKIFIQGTKNFYDMFAPFKLNPNIKKVKMKITKPLPFSIVLTETVTYKRICAIQSGNTESDVGIVSTDNLIYITVPNVNNADERFNFQLQVASLNGSIEPYIPPTSYPISPDGTATVNSISPSMTILPDTAGVTVDATYNLDGKKYVDKKFAELQALVLER